MLRPLMLRHRLPFLRVAAALITLLAVLVLSAAPASALEGWLYQQSPRLGLHSATSSPRRLGRAAELSARQQAIAADIERLQARLTTAPAPEQMKTLHAELQKAYDRFG